MCCRRCGLTGVWSPRRRETAFIAGIVIGALCVLAVVSTPLAQVLKRISSGVLRLLKTIGLLAVEVYKRIGAFLLGPIISYTLRQTGFSQLPTLSWTAQSRKGPLGSDFLPLSKKGCRVGGGHFTIRPDYSFAYWRAGICLMTGAQDAQTSDPRQALLFHIALDQQGAQPFLYIDRDGTRYGSWALQPYAHPRPSFEFDFSIYSGRDAGQLQITVSVDNECIQNLDFPQQYTEQLVLIAWADGQDSRVHFEKISVSWIPV